MKSPVSQRGQAEAVTAFTFQRISLAICIVLAPLSITLYLVSWEEERVLRELEAAHLGPSIKAKARLAGLMSHVGGYDHLVDVREAAERRKREAKSKHGPRRRVTLQDWPKAKH